MNRIIRKIFFHTRYLFEYYLIHKADPVSFLCSKGAEIGENCSLLGGLASFNSAEPYLIHIGNNVTITQGVILITHDGGTRVFRNNTSEWTKATVKMGTIEIGNNVFIGVGSILLPDIKIGSDVVIGAGSIVTRNIPSNTVAVGAPAHVISSIEDYQRRSLSAAITIPSEYLHERQNYLTEYYWGRKET